jgi:hypothetical protein
VQKKAFCGKEQSEVSLNLENSQGRIIMETVKVLVMCRNVARGLQRFTVISIKIHQNEKLEM